MFLFPLRIYIIILLVFSSSLKITYSERRIVLSFHLVIPVLFPWFPLSVLAPVLPRLPLPESLLYIMKKVEQILFFENVLLRKGQCQQEHRKRGERGGLCVPFRLHFSHLQKRFARKLGRETFCETPLSLPSLGFEALSRILAKTCRDSRRAKWFLLHPSNPH